MITWLVEGDRNTKFFRMIPYKRTKSKIAEITLKNGTIIDSEVDIKTNGVNFFKDLLTTSPIDNDFDLININPSQIFQEKKNGSLVGYSASSAESKITKRTDFAWKWAVKIPEVSDYKYFLCQFCDQRMTSGITRFKEHLAHTHVGVRACPRVPIDVKNECIAAMRNSLESKNTRVRVRTEIGGMETPEKDDEVEILSGVRGARSSLGSSSMAAPQTRGPLDKFVSKAVTQTTLNSSFKKEERHEACRAIGRFFYTSGIAFNAASNPYYYASMEKVANYGRGFKPPSSHEIRTILLKEEVFDIQQILLEYKKDWKTYGCTIMSDGWTDNKSRSILNFLVNSPKGTWYLKSIDSSASIKNSKLLEKYFCDVIDEIGEENVIQIITDSASNYKKAGADLMTYKKKLWWTPCAAHCIDLLLEDICKLKIFQRTIETAKFIVKFLYAHCTVLSLMRKYTQNSEIIRPAVTRFATCFLTLQSILKQKLALISMFSSQDWQKSEFLNHRDGIEVKKWILHDGNFWNHVAYCVKSVVPIVCVLREVDSEVRPAMGYLFELMDIARRKIASNLGNNLRKYGPIWKLFDKRWIPQLHQPLHAAGYYLNPQFHYEDNCINNEVITLGLEKCMDRMIVGSDRIKAEVQLDKFDRKMGRFGCDMAMKTRKKRSPVIWWEKYGTETPELMKFAIQVLSLTCSASGCERNWSTFESIHTKKRNRLEVERLHALVYVKYNRALRDRNIKRNNSMADPILTDEIGSDDEWIAEKEEATLPTQFDWFNEDLNNQISGLNIDAVRNVPPNTYESSLTRDSIPICVHKSVREPSPRASTLPRESSPIRDPISSSEPTSSREPASSLHEPIASFFKKKSSQLPSSSHPKRKRMRTKNLNDIDDGIERSNPYDETNPIYQLSYGGNDGNRIDIREKESTIIRDNDEDILDVASSDDGDSIDEDDLMGEDDGFEG